MIPVAGMGGNMLLIERLVALGTPRGVAVATLLLLWFAGKAGPLVDIFFAIFLIVALAIPGVALWLRSRGSHPLSPALRRFRFIRNLLGIVGEAPKDLIGDRALILKAAFFNGLVFFADAVTLAVCFRALGQGAPFRSPSLR
jgi:hypothetical protein